MKITIDYTEKLQQRLDEIEKRQAQIDKKLDEMLLRMICDNALYNSMLDEI